MASAIRRFHPPVKICKQNVLNFTKRSSSASTSEQEEYVDVAEYPVIKDTSKSALKKQERTNWYSFIQSLPTVEEKQVEINDRWYYGYHCHKLTASVVPHNFLPFAQYVTSTDFVENDMPKMYTNLDVVIEDILPNIRNSILDAAVVAFRSQNRSPRNSRHDQMVDRNRSQAAISHIVRALMRSLALNRPHLLDSQVSLNPRCEAFWVMRGFPLIRSEIDYQLRQQKKQHQLDIDANYRHLTHKAHMKEKQFLHDKVTYEEDLKRQRKERWFRYSDNLSRLHIRCSDPLPPFSNEFDKPEVTHPAPESWNTDPKALATAPTGLSRGTNIPGFWPGDAHEWGFIAFQSREHFHWRRQILDTQHDEGEEQEAVHAQAMMSAFGWLHSQAFFQGFTFYHDVTYPLTTQLIVTDGQIWSFYSYQLNTIAFHEDVLPSDLKRNVCWGLKEMKLFESIEDGEAKGVNDDVLRWLLKMFLLEPQPRPDSQLKPYLGDERYIANSTNLENRQEIEERFKHYMSHRPPKFAMPEKYDWEKIYKLRHKTRPMDSPRRYWEFQFKLNKPRKEKLNEKHFVSY